MSEYQHISNDLQTSLMRTHEELEAQRQMYLRLRHELELITEQAQQSELGRLYLLEKAKDLETERTRFELIARDLATAAEQLGTAEPPAIGAWQKMYDAIQRYKGMTHG